MKKRLLGMVLAVAMASSLALTGCGSGGDSGQSNGTQGTGDPLSRRIHLLQVVSPVTFQILVTHLQQMTLARVNTHWISTRGSLILSHSI